MAVNAVTELAARKIRKSAAFCGDFRRLSSGEKISTPEMNTAPKTTAKNVVMITDVLKILLLSAPGKNLIIEKSSPNRESRTSSIIEAISAVAVPTSCGEYSFAASIQKMKPKPADEVDVSRIKKEFLRRGSRRWCFISVRVFGIIIIIPAPQPQSQIDRFLEAHISPHTRPQQAKP